MSVFDEILCKLNEISNSYVRSLNEDIQVAFDSLEKFAEEYQNGRGKRDQNQKKALVNTLMSINEAEDENTPKEVGKSKDGSEKRLSSKRSKEQVEGMSSPEQEKRPKRNASVKAQNNISKQVNVNLTQKLRRDDPEKTRRRKDDDADKTRRHQDDDKENILTVVQVKQEKVSLPPEPMETESVLDIPSVPVKQEPDNDGTAMPPPAAPVPKPRKLPPKEKTTDIEEEPTGKRSTRTRKNTDSMPPPPVPGPSERPARASRRGADRAAGPASGPASGTTTGPAEPPAQPPPPPEPRPKRTRAKKKVSEAPVTDSENTQPPVENGSGTPDKPRPKRTRRGKKAAEEEPPKPKEPSPEPQIIPKEERISIPDPQSPAIPQKTVKKTKADSTVSITSDDSIQSKKGPKRKGAKTKVDKQAVEETQVLSNMNTTVTISMNKTVVLPNGVYDHTDGKTTIAMNETVVLATINRDTMVLDKPQAKIMDSTVVIEKDGAIPDLTDDLSQMTDDLSLMTDDLSLMTEDVPQFTEDDSEEYCTPGKRDTPPEPTSAVKAKVQQFEEMAARTTRTKTRAMAKKDAETEDSTPPDRIPKQVLSADTLNKMNKLIFNGKTTQISSSASKPTAKLPPVKQLPVSASKASALSRARDELLSKDDARRKKEAMLEAKKEVQKRKREEKMAAAAAAREAAEKERRAALQAQARDRMEKQAHADQGKLEKMKEVERKKQELARKVAETEERRRAEEQARLARLAEEQRKADAARRKQQEESEAMKKEAAMMAKEIEKRQKEYLEKQKKQRMETDKMHTPLKNLTKAPPMEPVYMQDGFQYLNSDDDDEDAPPKFPTPDWCKARHRQLALQQQLPARLVDGLFAVRARRVDLRAVFPGVERAALKRTSSAVWRTPPALQPARGQESPI
ncbi:histone-lysine N-methyltransferase 2B [Cydia pomonella]|uniref:histone-lysine N-methyltransferase 2B n=1 Tax=Cydia pomonella TaxID=82600 RepID=UPI002ADD3E06|nr:histone-lysine N-methyltransferase 2B [Cydia pomonella]